DQPRKGCARTTRPYLGAPLTPVNRIFAQGADRPAQRPLRILRTPPRPHTLAHMQSSLRLVLAWAPLWGRWFLINVSSPGQSLGGAALDATLCAASTSEWGGESFPCPSRRFCSAKPGAITSRCTRRTGATS